MRGGKGTEVLFTCKRCRNKNYTFSKTINFQEKNPELCLKKQQLISSEMITTVMSVNASSLIFYLNAKFFVLSFIVPASCAKPTSDNMEPNATILNI